MFRPGAHRGAQHSSTAILSNHVEVDEGANNMAVVVGFIATAEGRAALEAAIEEAKLRSRRLLVLVHGAREEDSDAIEEAMEEARSTIEPSGVDHEVRHLKRGNDVAEALVHTAIDTDAELIVIGIRRRSPLGKLILGSNAQRILLESPCHVLAAKPVE